MLSKDGVEKLWCIIGFFRMIGRLHFLKKLAADFLFSVFLTAFAACMNMKPEIGSGYSSFSDLCDYPIDIIKIDRHIVAKSTTPRGKALLCAIVNLPTSRELK